MFVERSAASAATGGGGAVPSRGTANVRTPAPAGCAVAGMEKSGAVKWGRQKRRRGGRGAGAVAVTAMTPRAVRGVGGRATRDRQAVIGARGAVEPCGHGGNRHERRRRAERQRQDED